MPYVTGNALHLGPRPFLSILNAIKSIKKIARWGDLQFKFIDR